MWTQKFHTTLIFCSLHLELANELFGSSMGHIKFGSGKVRVTQILFGLIKFGSGSVLVRIEFGLD